MKTASKRQPPPIKYQFTSENQPANRGRKPKLKLDELLTDLLGENDNLEKILRTHIKLAINGSQRSADLILTRMFGREPIKGITENEQPITLVYVRPEKPKDFIE